MGVKYKMTFVNAQEITCVVNFIVDDDVYSEDPIIIYGGPSPFTLSEFNQENDFFKPIRPQQATIQVLASGYGLRLEDFIIEDNDRQMRVRFDFGQWIGYWYGILSQEDMSEIWISQNHILTLRADEGFGYMKTIQLADFEGVALSGTYTPFQLLQYASTETVRSFLITNIISNLFHNSMSYASKQTGIDQCRIDSRTFENSPGSFDDSYTVIEKINRAFNQTLFQYDGEWWIVRQEELFIPKASNLVGFTTNRPTLGQRQTINTRYMVNIGVNEKVKPIMPEMLKTINKPSKTTTVRWDWDDYEQVVVNESFRSGSYIGSTGTQPNQTERYSVSGWSLFFLSGNPLVDTPSTKLFERQVVFANNTIQDEYIIIQRENVNVANFIKSQNLYITKDSKFDISIQYSRKYTFGSNVTDTIMRVMLYGNDSTEWYLRNDGEWSQTSSLLTVSYASGTGADWYDKSVSSIVPRDGYIVIRIISTGDYTEYSYYRNLEVDVAPPMQKYRRDQIAGDADIYTINKLYKNSYDETIYLSNSNSPNYKGSILQNDGITLTSGEWFRRRYLSEVYSFKKNNAIAHWFLNQRSRIKLECYFYGLIWDKDGSNYPIGLVNTINFVDDIPTKTFAIVNMREIDFMNCTWQAELLEIWDEDLDNDVIPDASDVYNNDLYYK